MLPELSLLHRGTSSSPPAGQSFPLAAAGRAARPTGSDAGTLVHAPRWSLMALERDAAQRIAAGDVASLGLARRVLVPSAVGAASVVGLMALAGLLVAVGVASTIVLALAVVMRLRVTQRWCERQRLAQLDHDAGRLRAHLLTKLRREHREELECLTMLVDNVREHETLRTGHGRTVSTLVARLDALLLSYVDRAIEVRRVAAAFAVTLDDEPTLPQAGKADEAADAMEEPERRRCFQILHLRTRARELCRRRIQRMERELASIGQLVRLVHEQALASGLPHDELASMLAEVLDEAEHARMAREEIDAAMMPGGLDDPRLPRAAY